MQGRERTEAKDRGGLHNKIRDGVECFDGRHHDIYIEGARQMPVFTTKYSRVTAAA